MAYSGYIDLKYKPSRNDLVCEFRVEPASGVGFRKASEAVAGESSIGTWTDVKSSKPYVERLAARVFEMKKPFIKVAYPIELFEPDNIPQILSSVAGNIFGMKIVRNLRLEDINLPDKVINSFEGPKFGIRGVRKLLGVHDRPLVGTIVKPKLGLRTSDHAKVAYDAWAGGCDIVKDDENLSNMRFNPFRKRVIQTIKARNRAERKSGEKKVYMPNVTAETKQMLDRARFVKGQGGRYIMIDIMTTGWSALQTLRNADLGLVIHAHRAMHAAVTRNPRHGISMLVVAKLARLIGVDQIHIGALGKMKEKKEKVVALCEEIEKRIVKPCGHVLEEDWHHIKPVFAVCSGGLHPGLVPRLVHLLGKDIVIQAGGGIHAHPLGTKAGACALRQAVNASIQNISLEEYSNTKKELKIALNKWGHAVPK